MSSLPPQQEAGGHQQEEALHALPAAAAGKLHPKTLSTSTNPRSKCFQCFGAGHSTLRVHCLLEITCMNDRYHLDQQGSNVVV